MSLFVPFVLGIFSISIAWCFAITDSVRIRVKSQCADNENFLVEYSSAQYQDLVATIHEMEQAHQVRSAYDLLVGSGGATWSLDDTFNDATGNPTAARWFGDYVAVCFDAANRIRIFANIHSGLIGAGNNSSNITPKTPIAVDVVGAENFSLAVACTGGGSSKVVIYTYGSSLNFTTSAAIFTTAGDALDIRWSPNGKYLAVCGSDGVNQKNNNIVIYEFDGESLTVTTSISISPGATSTANSIAWTQDGNYLIAGGKDTTKRYIKSYAFNNQTLSPITSLDISVTAASVGRIITDQTGKYVVCATGTTGGFNLNLFTTTAGNLMPISVSLKVSSEGTATIDWLSNYNYVAAAYSDPSATTASMQLFRFKQDDFRPVGVTTVSITPGGTFRARGVAAGSPFYALFLTEHGPDGLNLYQVVEPAAYSRRQLRSNLLQQYDIVQDVFDRPRLSEIPGGKFVHSSSSTVAINSVDWHPSGDFVALGGIDGAGGSEIRVLSWDGAQLTDLAGCNKDHGADILNVAWRPDGKYLAVCGVPQASNTALPSIRLYSFDATTSLSQVATLTPGSLSVNQIAWSPNGKYLGAAYADSLTGENLAIYSFDGSTCVTVTSSSIGTNQTAVDWHPTGTIFVSALDGSLRVQTFNGSSIGLLSSTIFGSTVNAAKWDPMGRYLAACGTTGTNELKVYSFDNANLSLITSFSNGVNLAAVEWSPDGGHLAVVGTATRDVTLRIFDFEGGRLRENPLCFHKHGGNLFSVSWDFGGSRIMLGGQSSTAGTFQTRMIEFLGLPDQTIIDSSRIHALAQKSARMAFEDATIYGEEDAGSTELGTIDHGRTNVHFASSSITLSYRLNISADHTLNIHNSGVINGNGHVIHITDFQGASIILDAGISVTLQNMTVKNFTESSVSLGSGARLFFGNNTTVELGQSQSLTNSWRFAGYATLYGGGYTLRPGVDPAYIAVSPGGRLLLENVIVENVQDNNLRCLATNASMVFKNCHLALANDFSFTVGSLLFQGDVIISGTSEFSYRSSTSSSIDTNGRLILDTDVILTYSPSVNSKDLLFLTDSSSQLQLSGNTIRTSTAGWRLTKGRLIVEGKNSIDSTATALSQAIEFGDGVASHDLQITIMPGASLNLVSGFVNYLNVG